MKYVICVSILVLPCLAWGFSYKKASDFPLLDSHKSAEHFERNYKKYEENCLVASPTAEGALLCFVGPSLWERELKIVYETLMDTLTAAEKIQLQSAQRAWMNYRDLDTKAYNLLLKRVHEGQEIEFKILRKGDFSRNLERNLKARVLALRQWLSSLD